MNNTRQETIVYGDVAGFAAGTVFDHSVVTFTDSQGNHQGVNVAPGAQPVSVTLAAETYTATVQAFDAAGNALAPPVSDGESIVISAPATISLSLPTSMTGVTA